MQFQLLLNELISSVGKGFQGLNRVQQKLVASLRRLRRSIECDSAAVNDSASSKAVNHRQTALLSVTPRRDLWPHP